MRNKLILYLAIFALIPILVSCVDELRGPKAPQSKRMELDTNSQYYDQQYKVYTLEGCEYIVVGFGNTRWGSHKGDCKNSIHSKDTKELEDYIKNLQDENKRLGSELGYRFNNEKK
jgi:hypothetical protein